METSQLDLQALITTGKDQGFLTYDQVNDYLPDEAVSPEKLDLLLAALDEKGISLVDAAPVKARGAWNCGDEPTIQLAADTGSRPLHRACSDDARPGRASIRSCAVSNQRGVLPSRSRPRDASPRP